MRTGDNRSQALLFCACAVLRRGFLMFFIMLLIRIALLDTSGYSGKLAVRRRAPRSLSYKLPYRRQLGRQIFCSFLVFDSRRCPGFLSRTDCRNDRCGQVGACYPKNGSRSKPHASKNICSTETTEPCRRAVHIQCDITAALASLRCISKDGRYAPTEP